MTFVACLVDVDIIRVSCTFCERAHNGARRVGFWSFAHIISFFCSPEVGMADIVDPAPEQLRGLVN